jgi:hypothetical protein
MSVYRIKFPVGKDGLEEFYLIYRTTPIQIGEIIGDAIGRKLKVLEIKVSSLEDIIEIKTEYLAMGCEKIEQKIFTIYNKNGFAFKFDANQGYHWRYGVDEGEFIEMAGDYETWSNGKVNHSKIEVWRNDIELVAVFTDADVCNFDGTEFLNQARLNPRNG